MLTIKKIICSHLSIIKKINVYEIYQIKQKRLNVIFNQLIHFELWNLNFN